MRHTFKLASPHVLAALPLSPDDAQGEGFAVPEWVNILPLPDENDRIVSRDFRQLVIDDAAKLVKRSNAALKRQGGGGLVDKDHRSYGWFTDGTKAIGWAEEYDLRDTGVYARVMWLPEGREAIASGQYRYTSSVINGPQEWVYDEHSYPTRLDIFPREIEGFGITNTPALATLAMFAAADEETMDKKIIEIALAKLGLADADVATLAALPVEQLRQRLTAAPATRAMFNAEGAAPEADVEAPVEPEPADDDEESDEVEPQPDASEPAPVEQLARANARIAQLEALNRKLETDAADTFVASLVHSAKITPAQRKAALALAQTPAGRQQLSELYAQAPAVLTAGSAPRSTPTTTATDETPFGMDPLAIRLAREGKTITEIKAALLQRDKENTHR